MSTATAHQYSLVVDEEGTKTLTIHLPEDDPVVVTGEHPNFSKLLTAAESGAPTEEIVGYANIAKGISNAFRQLTDRVGIKGEKILLDGDPIHGALGDHIVRCFTEANDPRTGQEKAKPLLNFLERIATNPSERSKEQLYQWLNASDFTITDDGHFIAYKGVLKDDNGGWTSSNAGPAIVDGQEHKGGRVPNKIGSTITIPRSKVDDNPRAACSTGLHVGTWDYASTFTREGTLKALVDPRDVVSVPNDSGAVKVRVCRYTVLDVTEDREVKPIVPAPAPNAPAPDPKTRVQTRVQPTGLPAFKIKKGQTIHEKGKKDRPNKTITKVGRDYIECDNNPKRPISKANVHKRYELIKDVS